MDRLPTEVLARVAEFLPCADGWAPFRLACRAFRAASAEASKLLRLHDHTRAAALSETFGRARLLVDFISPEFWRWASDEGEEVAEDEDEDAVGGEAREPPPALTFPDGFRRVLAAGRVADLFLAGYDLATIGPEDLARVERLSLKRCTNVGHLLRYARTLSLDHCFDDRPASFCLGRAQTLVARKCRLALNISTLGEGGPEPARPAPTFRHLKGVRLEPRGRASGLDGAQAFADAECFTLTNSLGFRGLEALARVRYVSLSGCGDVSDASALRGARELDLAYTSVADASMLGEVGVLSLAGTPVADVSALGKVRQLSLAGCKNVTDVAPLGGVHSLNLSRTAVADVGGLGGVANLYLRGCRNVHDLSMLGRAQFLDASETQISSLAGLSTIKELKLLGCPHVLDLSGLEGFAGVVHVTIYPETRALHALRGAQAVHLQLVSPRRPGPFNPFEPGAHRLPVNPFAAVGAPPAVDLPPFRVFEVGEPSLARASRVPVFDLGPLEGAQSIEVRAAHTLCHFAIGGLRAFACAKKVALAQIKLPDEAVDMGFLEKSEEVRLEGCLGVKTLRGLASAKLLELRHCGIDLADLCVPPTLEEMILADDRLCVIDLEPLSGVNAIRIKGREIRVIKGLKGVRQIDVLDCPKLEELSNLAGVEAVLFAGCNAKVATLARELGGPLTADGMADPARPFAGPVFKTWERKM